MSKKQDTIAHEVERTPRTISYPTKSDLVTVSGQALLSELFGHNVYGRKQLEATLPKPIYAKLSSQMSGAQVLDKATADAIAHAVKVWAMERGATHFTHWFQPLTNSTAEKHDCFLSFGFKASEAGIDVIPMDSFSGSQLIQAEPDASSFPNGGARSTFEARGYTIWDTTSPMFLQDGPHGTKILYIPSIFISYNGDALDEKTVLLRSCSALSTATIQLLRLLGDEKTKRVHVTLGTEQEFFLIDRQLYAQRPDLKQCGRTLCGVPPAKHQQLEDHYFGSIPPRVLAAISEAELELWQLGVPVKTRHNEVAPHQFEVAPIFEEASVAVDHNLLTMQVLHRVAHRHGLKALFHEKPFAGVNGSGKHCNWSLSTDTGVNLLEPSDDEPFLFILVSILVGLQRHGLLLRAAIASASNEHRLGANEAPPSIISAFLGANLTAVLDCIISGSNAASESTKNSSSANNSNEGSKERKSSLTNKPVSIGRNVLNMQVATLPEINRDLTDRNRTSPMAFTGNKFEFRAVGSKQSPSFPVSMLNALTTAGIREIIAALKGLKINDKASRMACLREFILQSRQVCFEGDGYSQEWAREATQVRHLPNVKSAPEAFAHLLRPPHSTLLTDTLGIMTQTELASRTHVLAETYVKDMMIEASVLRSLSQQLILPAMLRWRKELTTAASAARNLDLKAPEQKWADQMGTLLENLDSALTNLDSTIKHSSSPSSSQNNTSPNNNKILEHAQHISDTIPGALSKVRAVIDEAEAYLADDLYPFPKYSEMLFTDSTH